VRLTKRYEDIKRIIKQKYTISKDVLAEISQALEGKGADTLQIGQD
jgi:putative ATP-dependent endonuclease of the OLD family